MCMKYCLTVYSPACPEKSVVSWINWPSGCMTIAVDWEVKPQTEQTPALNLLKITQETIFNINSLLRKLIFFDRAVLTSILHHPFKNSWIVLELSD